MPSVASEVPVQPPKRPEPMPGRPNPSARTSSTPFDRVLDATANPPSPPPRADRPERLPADQVSRNAPDTPAPAGPGDAQPPCAPSKAAANGKPGEKSDPGENVRSNQPAVEAVSVVPDVPIQPVEIAVADKGPVASEETAALDDAKSADAKSADATSADAAVLAVVTTAATAAATAPTPAAAAAVIAIPVAPATALHPGTPGADDEIAAASQPTATATNAGVTPAQVQSPQAPVAAEAVEEKTGAPKPEELSAKAAPAAAAKPTEPVQAEAAAPIPVSPRPDGKTDTPKSAAGRSARVPSPRPAPAPAAQSAETRSDTADKPAAPVVHAHGPAADHAVAAAHVTFSEARDGTAAGAAPAQPNAALPAVNPAAPALAMPTLAPIAALRLDAAPGVAVPVAGLAVEIVSRAQEGLKRFDIRLDPPDLGRIDVRLDVDHDGRVTSRLIVERAETLDLLRRDAPALERALQQAGLKTNGGIDFSLRDQSLANQNLRDQASRDDAPTTRLIIPDDELPPSEAVRGYGRLIGLGGGIDIRV